jgi:hypothetical protein
MFRDPERFRDRVKGRVDELRSDIRDEVELLHNDATPWEVATILRDQVENYGTLHRALNYSKNMLGKEGGYEHSIPTTTEDPFEGEEGGTPMAVEPWNNSLPPAPEINLDEPFQKDIELHTLDDYEWVIRAFECDRSTFDVHEVPGLKAETLARRLGTDVLYGQLEKFRPLVLPETWERYRDQIREEFGVDPEVELIGVDLSSTDEETTKARLSDRADESWRGKDEQNTGQVSNPNKTKERNEPMQDGGASRSMDGWAPFGQEQQDYESADTIRLIPGYDIFYRFEFKHEDEIYEMGLKLEDEVADLVISKSHLDEEKRASCLIEDGQVSFKVPYPDKKGLGKFRLENQRRFIWDLCDGGVFRDARKIPLCNIREYQP